MADQQPQLNLQPSPSASDFDAGQWVLAQRRNAVAAAIGGADSNPQEAADAIQIGETSNVPSTLADMDVNYYKDQQRAALISSIVGNNDHLRDYVLGHPLAAKISANDWGQLDSVSDSLKRFLSGTKYGTALTAMAPIAGAAIGGAVEAIGPQPLFTPSPEEVEQLTKFGQQHPIAYTPVVLGAAAIKDVTDIGRLMGGLVAGTVKGGAEFYHQLTGNSADEKADNILQAISDPGLWATIGPEGEAAAEFLKPLRNATSLAAKQQISSALQYIREDKPVPPELGPLARKFHAEQARIDAENLDNLVTESATSQTKSLAPNFFADQFLRQRAGGNILVDADAVQKLYGEKAPAADDNLLGWVPQIQDQLAVAKEDGGGQIRIPLADWVAHVTPEVAKSLHDDIQFRPGGVTLNEAKEIDKEKLEFPEGLELPEALAAPTDIVRQVAGIEPAPRNFDYKPAIDKGIIPEKSIIGGSVDIAGKEFPVVSKFSAKDAIAEINPSQLTGVPRALHEFFADRLEKMAGDTPIYVVNHINMEKLNDYLDLRPGTPGFYMPDTHAIILRNDYANGSRGHNIASWITMHEITHAATTRAIINNPGLRSDIRAIMDDTNRIWTERLADVRKKHAYAFKNEHEFIAESRSNQEFQAALAATPMSNELASRLDLHAKDTLWEAVKNILKKLVTQLIGREVPPSILDALMTIGPRLEEAGKADKEARAAFGAPAPTLSEQIAGLLGKGRGEKYLEKMAERDKEDAEFQSKLAEARAKKQQTSEWKANRKDMREQVEDEISHRPQIAADNLLQNGELYGEKVKKPKLDRAQVPAELRKSIPNDYLADSGGADPNAIAEFFGYQTGNDMLEDIARLRQAEDEAGLTHSAYISSLVDAQTDRRMLAKYGTLEQSILEEAKDHVLGPSELDRLHDEMMALNTIHRGKEGLPEAEQLLWSKSAIKSRVSENVASGRYGNMDQLSSDHFFDLIGRLGKKIEDSLMDKEYHEAFKLSQRRLIAAHIAAEVKKYEKLQSQFKKKLGNWRKREPSGLRQEDAIWIHQILSQIELPARRSVQDFEQQRELVSQHKNLREYYNSINKAVDTDPDAMPAVQNLSIMEELLSSDWHKSIDTMSPEEFQGVFDSLKSIDNWGRNAKKVEVKGSKEDLEKVVSGLVDRLKASVGGKPQTLIAGGKSVGRTLGSLLLNTETWLNRLDLGNRLGPFNQLIGRPITEGQYELRNLEREFSTKWRALGEPIGLRQKINNDLFRDQDGDLLPMTRGNALAVLQNMGNKLQRAKLVFGWRISDNAAKGEAKIWDWLQRVGIGPDDLARAQALGRIFEEAFERAEKVWVHTAGVAPPRIALGAMHTPWGISDEWYHPLIPDPLRKNIKLTADDMINESGYFRPSPAHGYTKLRTGAIYPIDLTFDSVPLKLKQILNDTAMRIPVTEVGKIVYDKSFQSAFKKYYGPEYFSGLDSWMKDVARNRQWVPGNLKSLDMAVNALQRNFNTLLIGMGWGTVAKHAPTAAAFSMSEVGFRNFTTSLLHMLYELPGSRERWNFAMENSEELQNRMRNIADTLIVSHRELFSTAGGLRRKYDNFRDTVEKYGHAPVAYTDLYSAVAMWDAEYRRLAQEHPEMSHGDLIYSANTAVRRTHGSSILSNRSAIMRSQSPLTKLLIPFYNFFNNALQRNYELAWKAKLAFEGRKLPEMKGFLEDEFKKGPQHILPLIGGVMVYGVIPSLIEQIVDPLPEKKGESGFVHWAKILTRAYPSMIPIVRDIVNGLWTHHDPSVGLFGTAARDVAEGLNPTTYINNPGQAIQNANRLFGALTGLTYEPIGKAGKFTANVLLGKEHPKGMGDLFRGELKGTLKQRRQP